MKKIKTKIKRLYDYKGHYNETYDKDRDIPYIFDVYKDDDGNQWEVKIGVAYKVDNIENDKDDITGWMQEGTQ